MNFPVAPSRIFLIIAAIFGFALLVVAPPFSGADEPMHYERTYEIATGQFLGTSVAPEGISRFIGEAFTAIRNRIQHDRPFTLEQLSALNNIPLNEEIYTPLPHPERKVMAIHNPVSYLPSVIAFRAGLWLEMSPLKLLYLSRLASLVVALMLIWLALRQLPAYSYSMAAIALLPTAVFIFATLTTDGFTIGLSYLFIALVIRNSLVTGSTMDNSQAAALIAVAFLLAQCKSAYLLLPLLVVLIPKTRFTGSLQRVSVVLLAIVPGFIASLSWILLAKSHYFDGISYQSWGGQVNPDMQIQYILSEPHSYVMVIIRTLFSPGWIIDILTGLTGALGWLQVSLSPVIFVLLFAGLVAVLICDPTRSLGIYRATGKTAYFLIFILTVVISLTFLYIQWTQLYGDLIQGFQGRYLLPVLPLLLAILPASTSSCAPSRCAVIITATATIGLTASVITIIAYYYFGTVI
ncbi:MAG: DUF2142 domain-containing protein [bacterium]